MPGRAQWWDHRGPFAALVLLFGLLASAACVSGPSQVRDAISRLTPVRSSSAATVPGKFLRANSRETPLQLLADFHLPPSPTIVRHVGLIHPLSPPTSAVSTKVRPARFARYRARAPPEA